MTGDDDRLAYIRAIIRHRVPEATDADIALIAQPEADTLPVEIGAQILEVIEVLETRMTELEDAVTLTGPKCHLVHLTG